MLVPEPGALKLAVESFVVIPLGWPETESVTLDLNPPLTLTLRPTAAFAPSTTVIDPVVPANVIPGPEVTFSASVRF